MKASAAARGRWQLDGRVTVYSCGCRNLDTPGGDTRRVATCVPHRPAMRGTHAVLHPWQPATGVAR